MEAYNKKIPGYLMGAFCAYLFYYAFTIIYVQADVRWHIIPGLSLAAVAVVLIFRRESVAVHAYTITICTFINIMGSSVMLHEFTEMFMVICAAVSLISFYHMPQLNYLMLGFSTVDVLYWLLWEQQWRAFLNRDGFIGLLMRIISLYLVQILLIILIKSQQKMKELIEQKAREAEVAGQAKEDFLANMSHEIRTPMNAITGMVELALRNEELPEQEKEYLYNIQSAGEDLLSIIDDILDVTKIDSGNLEITEEEYEITSIVHDVVNIMQVMLDEKEVELLADIDPNIPVRLKGDGFRIKQVMMNLLDNAVKYTEQGKISLKLEAEPVEGQDAKILLKGSVTDTGIGISQEQMNDLFTIFKQVDSRRNRSAGGSGLGLAISRKLVELMQGTLSAESELGKGSVFTFAVPQEVIDARPCMEQGRQAALQSAMQKEADKKERERRRKKAGRQITFTAPDAKILLVDDNKVNLKVAEGLLRPYHMNVETADSGSRAIEMVQNERFDLVFMDHMMPVMDGVDATKIIREMQGEYFQKVAIVALSANAVRGAKEMFLEAGMNDFVAKPIEMRIMDRTLRRWLPEDKIISNKNEEEAADMEGDDANDPYHWKMEGIDMEAAMEYACQDVELYREVLSDYRDSIHEKADVIERAVADQDLEMYTIEVHSLKSTSRSIGALRLSELAQELEESGKAGKWEVIVAKTPALLSVYRGLYDAVAPYCREEEVPDAQKKPFLQQEVFILLGQLLDCMNEYDSIRGEETVKMLSEYAFPASGDRYMEQISKAIGRFDYDVCKEVVLKWRQELADEANETEGN
ncbi:MAG: ATP-binding protein [Clostridiales bacterium]|nr:ATP-binding protein [Clostridiales bacterium]